MVCFEHRERELKLGMFRILQYYKSLDDINVSENGAASDNKLLPNNDVTIGWINNSGPSFKADRDFSSLSRGQMQCAAILDSFLNNATTMSS